MLGGKVSQCHCDPSPSSHFSSSGLFYTFTAALRFEMLLFHNGDSIEDLFRPLKNKTLVTIIRSHVPGARIRDLESRAKIYKTVSQLTSDLQVAIIEDVMKALERGDRKHIGKEKIKSKGNILNSIANAAKAFLGVAALCPTHSPLSTTPLSPPNLPSSEPSLSTPELRINPHGLGSSLTPAVDMEMAEPLDDLLSSNFMKPVAQDLKDNIIRNFIEQTNNKALAVSTCGACAREEYRNQLEMMNISDIPNSRHLAPSTPHSMHTLLQGLLLHPDGVSSTSVSICSDCLSHLKRDQLPPFSLANNMWIGDIPRELSVLTLPERMLIAKYFPAAYIVKLYPKQRGARNWDNSQMHSGLRGNVSTYRLDPAQVAGMIDGRLMPPPAIVLSATIGVTFVTPKNTREHTMPNMFRVRRERVRLALLWLKTNNPLYADIIISEERLAELPVSGVPDEIRLTARHSDNMEALHREHDGYVPLDAEDEGKLSVNHDFQCLTIVHSVVVPFGGCGRRLQHATCTGQC